MKRDLEDVLWEVYAMIGDQPLEEVDRRIKLVDILAKIRVAGERVKPDQKDSADSNRAAVQRIVEEMNQ